eukprot:TRINITY_DN6070_c0_g1_i6.p1 TRINITY_DN6070_c0_g1~~TRINITY_DN6070_c0_g1_i6.p1  ORF type:complete len:1505 (+),score=268.89 TRINITY_DN6070_c0_g1_i6:1087-5601(+)
MNHGAKTLKTYSRKHPIIGNENVKNNSDLDKFWNELTKKQKKERSESQPDQPIETLSLDANDETLEKECQENETEKPLESKLENIQDDMGLLPELEDIIEEVTPTSAEESIPKSPEKDKAKEPLKIQKPTPKSKPTKLPKSSSSNAKQIAQKKKPPPLISTTKKVQQMKQVASLSQKPNPIKNPPSRIVEKPKIEQRDPFFEKIEQSHRKTAPKRVRIQPKTTVQKEPVDTTKTMVEIDTIKDQRDVEEKEISTVHSTSSQSNNISKTMWSRKRRIIEDDPEDEAELRGSSDEQIPTTENQQVSNTDTFVLDRDELMTIPPVEEMAIETEVAISTELISLPTSSSMESEKSVQEEVKENSLENGIADPSPDLVANSLENTDDPNLVKMENTTTAELTEASKDDHKKEKLRIQSIPEEIQWNVPIPLRSPFERKHTRSLLKRVDEGCKICLRDIDRSNILLCDGCNQQFHLFCITPPLFKIPKGEWFCWSCREKDTTKPVESSSSAEDTLINTKEDEKEESVIGVRNSPQEANNEEHQDNLLKEKKGELGNGADESEKIPLCNECNEEFPRQCSKSTSGSVEELLCSKCKTNQMEPKVAINDVQVETTTQQDEKAQEPVQRGDGGFMDSLINGRRSTLKPTRTHLKRPNPIHSNPNNPLLVSNRQQSSQVMRKSNRTISKPKAPYPQLVPPRKKRKTTHNPSTEVIEDSWKCKICFKYDHLDKLMLCEGDCAGWYHSYCMGFASVPHSKYYCPTCPVKTPRQKEASAYECNSCKITDFRRMLRCDQCEQCVHLHCLDRPLENITIGDWFCSKCRGSKLSSTPNQVQQKPQIEKMMGFPIKFEVENDGPSILVDESLLIFSKSQPEPIRHTDLKSNRCSACNVVQFGRWFKAVDGSLSICNKCHNSGNRSIEEKSVIVDEEILNKQEINPIVETEKEDKEPVIDISKTSIEKPNETIVKIEERVAFSQIEEDKFLVWMLQSRGVKISIEMQSDTRVNIVYRKRKTKSEPAQKKIIKLLSPKALRCDPLILGVSEKEGKRYHLWYFLYQQKSVPTVNHRDPRLRLKYHVQAPVVSPILDDLSIDIIEYPSPLPLPNPFPDLLKFKMKKSFLGNYSSHFKFKTKPKTTRMSRILSHGISRLKKPYQVKIQKKSLAPGECECTPEDASILQERKPYPDHVEIISIPHLCFKQMVKEYNPHPKIWERELSKRPEIVGYLVIPDDKECVVTDKHGEMLIHSYPKDTLSNEILSNLERGLSVLQKAWPARLSHKKDTNRGAFLVRHVCCWKRYERNPHMSTCYLGGPSRSHVKDMRNFQLTMDPVNDVVNQKLKEDYPFIFNRFDDIEVPPECVKVAGVFPGFALNEQVSTQRHRDFGDYPQGACVAVSFGNFTGGELCFLEPKIVCKFSRGQVLFFRSSVINHWNLPCEGERNSIVYFVCDALLRWSDDLKRMRKEVDLMEVGMDASNLNSEPADKMAIPYLIKDSSSLESSSLHSIDNNNPGFSFMYLES